MDILFLTPELPHPSHGGGIIKTAALLAHLLRRHRVHLVCFTRNPPTGDQLRWMAEHAVDQVPLYRGRSMLNLLRSYLHGVPLSVERNRSRQMAALVSSRLRGGRYVAVFVDGWLMAQYLPARFGGLKLLHQHNAEHVMWGRQIPLERNAMRRALLRIEYGRVRRYEARIISRFDTVFAVSEPDRRRLAALGLDEARLRLLPNVADPQLLSREPLSPDGGDPVLLFLGTLSWEPNAAGLEWFLRDVLPSVRERVAGARLVIAGRGAGSRLDQLVAMTDGAELVGAVEDPEALYRSARLFVDVSLGGSGTRVKIVNAMARGLPVVATSDAAEGLEAASGEHLLVADDSHSMSKAITRLLLDNALWMDLAREARSLVRRRYVAEEAFRYLDEVLTVADRDRPLEERP